MKKSKKLQREWAKKVNVSAANQSVNASRHTLTKHVPKVGLPDVTFECEPSLVCKKTCQTGKVTLILKKKKKFSKMGDFF